MIKNKSAPLWIVLVCIYLVTLIACGYAAFQPTNTHSLTNIPAVSPTLSQSLLNQDQLLSLDSLELIDNYPLYLMYYRADYQDIDPSNEKSFKPKLPVFQVGNQVNEHNWGCSLFAALGSSEHPLFGRNFDWRYSPALLLYTFPEDGNASVSMVDLEYLVGDQAANLLELPPEQRIPLLNAPDWPFDGMNDCGLVIGMAAVPSSGEIRPDPMKKDIGSLKIMREVLDHTCTVDSALELMGRYNINWEGGPELHYLIAERSGQAVLVEFLQGAMKSIPNHRPWHLATNFLISGISGPLDGISSRYDTISSFMLDASGDLLPELAIDLLSQVSQDSTQWSIVYDLKNGEIRVVMGKDFSDKKFFQLESND